MDLALSPDQVAILDALDSLAKPYEAVPLHEAGFALSNAALDRAVAEGGFLDVGFDPDLGVSTAALVVVFLRHGPALIQHWSGGAVAAIRAVLPRHRPGGPERCGTSSR